jgi:hypothetical protein
MINEHSNTFQSDLNEFVEKINKIFIDTSQETFDITGFFFRIRTNAGLGATHLDLHLSNHAEKETRYIQYGPLLLFQ